MLHSDSFWKAQSSGGRKQRPARGWLASRLAATACKGGLFSCAVLDNDTGGQGEMWGEKHCLAARICTFGTWVTIRPDDGRRNMLAAVSCRQLSGTGSMFDTHTPACSCVYLCMRWSSLGSRPAAPSASGWATQGVWRKREGSGSPASTRSSGFFFERQRHNAVCRGERRGATMWICSLATLVRALWTACCGACLAQCSPSHVSPHRAQPVYARCSHPHGRGMSVRRRLVQR